MHIVFKIFQSAHIGEKKNSVNNFKWQLLSTTANVWNIKKGAYILSATEKVEDIQILLYNWGSSNAVLENSQKSASSGLNSFGSLKSS